ncbi:hypothetical protein [uncultured Eubacterium sp.]|uniref:hypothetical protein n=1 Tax=uncultured Eubacterium sp. TaxID=165185 RepID=UPI0025915DE1|nr:hypothetical protein [uncultured Eubacterium sp.]
MKKVIRIFAALAIIAVLGTMIMYVMKYSKSGKDGDDAPLEFSEELGVLPTVSTVCDEKEINSLHGYTTKMDTTKIHDSLVVVDKENRNFKIKIDKNGASVKNIHVDIVSFGETQNILSTDITKTKENDNKISAVLEFPESGQVNKEWVLIITLSTDDYNEVRYYSRIECLEKSFVKEQAEFVKFFSDTTFDYEKAASWNKGIIGYIEPDSNTDNSNLGHVTIKSSFAQVTWGNMEVSRVGEPTVTLLEMDGDVGAYELDYLVKAPNDFKQDEFYNVKEYFRVWSALDTVYLRSYDRTMEQVFEASGGTITSERINLGIQKTLGFDYKQSENNKYIAYVLGDSLWCINTDDYEATCIYTIGRNAKDNRKDSELECMSVDDDGNVEFIVYGYLNSKEHIGQNGIVAYSYNEEKNQTRERIFVEYDKPYEILANEVGTLYYIADGVLYIYIDSCINYVNLATKEHGQVVSNLEPGTYAVNDNMDTIAYCKDGNLRDAKSMTVMNFETGSVRDIEANEGERIRVCAYAGKDLIYGIANADEINNDADGNIVFPMKNMYILDKDLHVSTNYSKDDIRVTDVEVKGNMISLSRTKKGKNIANDQLFETKGDEEQIANPSFIVTELKETMPVLVFKYPLDVREKLVVKAAKIYVTSPDDKVEVETKETADASNNNGEEETKTSTGKNTYGGNTTIDLNIPPNDRQFYYLYIDGELTGIYSVKNKAISKAESTYGYVVNENGEKIYAYKEELQYKDASDRSID